jgi:type II secretory pathway pseudopilin PulG
MVELLVVIGLIGVLATAVIFFLNPIELLRQTRDTRRVSDLTILTLELDQYVQAKVGTLGTPSMVYVSIPDPTAPSCSSHGIYVSLRIIVHIC